LYFALVLSIHPPANSLEDAMAAVCSLVHTLQDICV
jgi:hypothetical protein